MEFRHRFRNINILVLGTVILRRMELVCPVGFRHRFRNSNILVLDTGTHRLMELLCPVGFLLLHLRPATRATLIIISFFRSLPWFRGQGWRSSLISCRKTTSSSTTMTPFTTTTMQAPMEGKKAKLENNIRDEDARDEGPSGSSG